MNNQEISHPHHISFTAYIDSSIRSTGSSSNFSCNIDLPPNSFDRVCLLQCSIPKSWYLYDTTNNTFTLRETLSISPFTTSTTTITIPVGNYTRINLASILSSLLTTNSSNNTYTISYPASTQTGTNKYTFSYTPLTGSRYNPSFIFSNNNCGIPLGFSGGTTNPFLTISPYNLVSSNSINLSSKTRLYLKSNLCSLSNKMILQEIFSNNVQDNGIIVYNQNEITANSKLFLSNSDNLFSFQLTDRFDNIVDLNGLDIVFSIYFYKTDDTNQYIKSNIILQNLQSTLN